MKYFISGLYEGTWKVSVNGGSAVQYTATAESGMIEFEGACGTVTVTPGGDVIEEGRATINYHLAGGTLPAGAQTTYEVGKAYTLPIPTTQNGKFIGWYTESSYDNKITEIPATATGTFNVYAKFDLYDIFADFDYSRDNEKPLTLQKDKTNGVPAEASITVDTENNCLVWDITSGQTKIYYRGTNPISNLNDPENKFTYVFELSKKPNVTLAQLSFNLQVSGSSYGKEYGAVELFKVNSTDNGVYVGSTKIGTLTNDGAVFKFAIVVDFDGANNGASALATAYSANGSVLGSRTLNVPSAAANYGVTTMLEWSEALQHIQVWFNHAASQTPGTVRIHKVWAAGGEHIPTSAS